MSRTALNPWDCDCPSADECKTAKIVKDFQEQFPGSHCTPKMYRGCKRMNRGRSERRFKKYGNNESK